MNLCSLKRKSHLVEPPPIRDIVLPVATVCSNNSLVCQLLFLPQWETGKRREGKSERKYVPLASCSRTAAPEPKTLGCFPLFFFTLSFLKGLFWRAAHRRAVFTVKCSPFITRPLVTSPCWMKSLTELQEDKPAFRGINQVHQRQSCWALDGHAGSVGSAAPGSDAG